MDADIEKVKELREIANYGVFTTPAVVIAGEVKSVSKVPTKGEMNIWLEAAADKQR